MKSLPKNRILPLQAKIAMENQKLFLVNAIKNGW